MPKGSNCALNHGGQLNSYSGCIKTELLNFKLMPKGSNCAIVYEYKPNLQVGCI